MEKGKSLIGLLALGLAVAAPATHAACDPLPAPVAGYVRAHAGWKVVRFTDLVRDDQALWAQYHKTVCPGWAKVRLDPRQPAFYAVALIRPKQEKLVLIDADGRHARDLVPADRLYNPRVVWTVPPGRYRDENTEKDVTVGEESVVFEAMEAAATQFYMKDGKIRSLLASQ